jgi:hypothetical protein
MSCHLQRLPETNIKRAQVGGKIVGQKDPGAADFGTRNATALYTPTQLFGMHPEEFRRLPEPKRTHSGSYPVGCLAVRLRCRITCERQRRPTADV